MSDRFEIIPFHQQQILTVQRDEGVFVVMKPIVETLGLAWNGQFERIKRHPIMSKGVRVIRIPSPGGMQEAVALDLEHFHGWLVSLNPERVKNSDKRGVVIEYQERAFRVIFEHFHGALGGPRGSTKSPSLPPVREIVRLIEAIKNEASPAVQQLYYDMLDQQLKLRGVATPALDALVTANPDRQVAEAFFAALLELQVRGIEFHQHRNPALLAVSLPALRPLLVNAAIDCPPDRALWKALRQHPSYHWHGNINCRDNNIRHCWIFNRSELLGFEFG